MTPAIAPMSPFTIRRPVMHNRWDTLTFLHWGYPPEIVQRLLPSGLVVDTWEGKAWVGLVPFFMQVRAPGQPWWPRLGRFCETNVRTYVREGEHEALRARGETTPPKALPSEAERGEHAVWFFSLEAARLGVVAIGRGAYGVPYHWARMRREQLGDEWWYESTRRWPGPKPATCRVGVRVGEAYEPDAVSDFEHWLSGRWRLYGAARSGRLRTAEADHERWPLHRAEVLECDQSLVQACGLPAPTEAPIAHWSPRVTVRIGRPRRI